MGIEIERKFLVTGSDWRTPNGQRICQGYLNRDSHRTVRVRISGQSAFLTIKGMTTGATRAEFEYAIPVAEAQTLLAMCDGPIIDKVRHTLTHDGMTWEVDEFLGDNAGLVVAEIELSAETQAFTRPPWVADEVTSDARYFNSNLAVHPYSRWG